MSPSKLLPQKIHFENCFLKKINLIPLIYSSSESSDSSEEENYHIIINMPNYFFLNVFTLI